MSSRTTHWDKIIKLVSWEYRGRAPLSFLTSAEESEFSDTGFIQVAEPLGNHAVELRSGGLSKREMETFFVGKCERDAAILRCMGAGEEAGVVAVLHILSVGFENLGVRASL